jgi:hypothetical protein
MTEGTILAGLYLLWLAGWNMPVLAIFDMGEVHS